MTDSKPALLNTIQSMGAEPFGGQIQTGSPHLKRTFTEAYPNEVQDSGAEMMMLEM